MRSSSERCGHPSLPPLRLALVTLAAGLLFACGSEPRPDLVLVTIDTARADRFGFMGDPGGLTPNADALAREATVFENCIAPMGTTTPSHASLFTGLHPRTHGVRSNKAKLPAEFRTLAETLGENGYDTGAFVSFAPMLTLGALDRGFGSVDGPDPERGRASRRGSLTIRAAQRWFEDVARNDRRPLFAWIHLYEPHGPYRPTSHSREKLRDSSSELAAGVSMPIFGLGAWMHRPQDRAAVHALYDGQLREADLLLGELLASMEQLGLLSNAVVVIAADHGQALGDHGHPGHGQSLWQSVLHVPLLVWDGRSRSPRRVRERVGLIDLHPTLLELAGLAVPAASEGRSLVPALRGEPLAAHSYYAEIKLTRGPGPREKSFFARGPPPYEVAAFRDRFKFMHGSDASALFDLATDSGETRPLDRAQAPDAYDRLSQQARHYADSQPASPAVQRIPESVAEGLRALGYAD
jgi:arylsulfatase A-like enzyme